jgi:hypothetical protein
MMGLYHETCIVEILESLDNQIRVKSGTEEFWIEQSSVIPIPDELYAPVEKKLGNLKQYINEGNAKLKEIKDRYLKKVEEIRDAITKASVEMNEIIRQLKIESLREKVREIERKG